MSGTAGAIAWEVRDIVQSVAVDGRAIRWDYRIIPRETSGTPVVFTTIEYTAQGSARSGLMATTTTTEFRRRLEANGQLERADNFTVIFTPNAVWSGFQNPATRELYTRYIRFIGQTEAGTPVSVMVAVPLSESVGRKLTIPSGGALPSRVELRADDLSRLAGTWRGYYRNPSAINIPLTASATERGDLDCQEGDPVNNRYRGAFAISDGAVSTTLGRENGTLHLHEGGGKRVLVGDIMVRTVAYPVRLESDLAIAVPAAKSASLPSDLKIVPPSPSVPPQLAALSGKWFGRMDNKRDLTMVFEKVEESGGVTVISTEKIGWIRVRVRASFVGPGLEFDSAPYTTPSINLRSRVQEDGSLAVCLSVAGVVVGRGRLARQPD